MRKFIIVMIMTFTLSSQAQSTKIIVLKQFLSDVMKFDGKAFDQQQPIISISEIAQANAAKVIEITRENIKPALEEAKSYKHCLVIVDAHTVVRVINNKDCSPSGAWRTAMPLSKGYIQKAGVLYEKKDYMKYLIGRPDSQTRTMYLFN